VNGRASVANPDQYSAGIDAVVVNGKVSYEPGRPLAMNGRPQWAGPAALQAELARKGD
jgi:hypothetical protein